MTSNVSFISFQGGGVNINQNLANTKGRDNNNSYVEVINNIESFHVNKSMGNITRYGQDCLWQPKHKTEGKFYGI